MKRAGDNPRHDSFVASGCNLLAGAIELVVGGSGSSLALFADTAHNLGDSAAYGINGLTADMDQKIHDRWRKRAAALVCASALAIGLRAGNEALSHDVQRPEPVAPIAAVAAGGLSYAAHRRTKHHKELDGGYADNARHAEWDVYCAPITIAATALASSGIPRVDSIGGVIVSGITIWINNPWKIH